MTDKVDVHVSSVETFCRCPRQWMIRWIQGFIRPPKWALVVGRRLHKLADVALKRKYYKQELMTGDEAEELARDGIKQDAANTEILLEPDEVKAGAGKTRELEITRCGKMSRCYAQELLPQFHPLSVWVDPDGKPIRALQATPEQREDVATRVEATVPVVEFQFALDYRGRPIKSVGTMDNISITDDPGDGARLRDLKGSSKSPTQDEADNSLQLTGYGLAAKAAFGMNLTGFALDKAVCTRKTQKTYSRSLTTERTGADFAAYVRILDEICESIVKDHWHGCHPGSWWCLGCGYRGRECKLHTVKVVRP